jgi:hypothetical protein
MLSFALKTELEPDLAFRWSPAIVTEYANPRIRRQIMQQMIRLMEVPPYRWKGLEVKSPMHY